MIAGAIGFLITSSITAAVGWYFGYKLGQQDGWHHGFVSATVRATPFVGRPALDPRSEPFEEIVDGLVEEAITAYRNGAER